MAGLGPAFRTNHSHSLMAVSHAMRQGGAADPAQPLKREDQWRSRVIRGVGGHEEWRGHSTSQGVGQFKKLSQRRFREWVEIFLEKGLRVEGRFLQRILHVRQQGGEIGLE